MQHASDLPRFLTPFLTRLVTWLLFCRFGDPAAGCQQLLATLCTVLSRKRWAVQRVLSDSNYSALSMGYIEITCVEVPVLMVQIYQALM
ncbi:hypothetical protein BGZ61DRAFT_457328 [Ilyonectria robusta]|uniref:uncharacterized protein n=1 Tax=Ilyonectria robusta TaxID=1079257 RepID=UPI001E8ED5D9|nr:uncharacterized protein BGZ61DRAFT_457328 [Ilyonectria robusta]KAH8676959.1 hypothetical protein BGZ61DRAFT_457328 [Ilyonectria robusta]